MRIDNTKCDMECMMINSRGQEVPKCVDLCPVDGIFVNKHGDLEIDSEICIGCGSCYDIFTDGAIVRGVVDLIFKGCSWNSPFNFDKNSSMDTYCQIL